LNLCPGSKTCTTIIALCIMTSDSADGRRLNAHIMYSRCTNGRVVDKAILNWCWYLAMWKVKARRLSLCKFCFLDINSICQLILFINILFLKKIIAIFNKKAIFQGFFFVRTDYPLLLLDKNIYNIASGDLWLSRWSETECAHHVFKMYKWQSCRQSYS
jgi:hypothetical protein